MQIEKFADQFELLAEAYGITTAALHQRMRDDDRPRWIAVDNGRGLGAAVAWRDPDRRVRLTLDCHDSTAYRPLVHAAAADIKTDIHTSVSGSDLLLRRAFTAEGFRLDFTEDVFAARFTTAARALKPARLPDGYTLITADRADGRSWFTLDNTLRQDVRGCEGWRGDLKWFAEHNQDSADFDPSAYLIAVDDTNGEYAGLVRFRKHREAGPRLEMLAVLRQYRACGLGRALLARGVDIASAWGHDGFTGATARDAAAMRSLWITMGATDTDSRQTLVLRR
ncbi:MAG: GNAT family N-acetyltransferase [Stackebrandtia sp.]